MAINKPDSVPVPFPWSADQSRHSVLLPAGVRKKHSAIVGASGAGKTRHLASGILQDIVAGRGVAVFDKHGTLFQLVLAWVALLAQYIPGLLERVIAIDPPDPIWTVMFNSLEPIPGMPPERQAEMVTDIIVKIWQLETMARTLRVLHFALLALILARRTLLDMRKFLLDEEWRRTLLAPIQHPEVRAYFQEEFPRSRAEQMQYLNPVLVRLDKMNLDPDTRLMFATRSTIDLRQVLDRRLVLLVNLSKGQLMEGNGNLLGALLLAHLERSALARGEAPTHSLYFLYLDEFAEYTHTRLLEGILSAMRKYNLILVLAHQYLSQLPQELLDAVMNNIGTLSVFRVGYRDASLLARELFPPGYVQKQERELRFMRLGGYPFPYFSKRSDSLGHEELASLLTMLNDREFVLKVRGPYPPQKLRTLNMEPPPMSEALSRAIENLRCVSGQRYGRLKIEVRAELDRELHKSPYAITQRVTTVTDYEEI